jgi:hypothetical protein
MLNHFLSTSHEMVYLRIVISPLVYIVSVHNGILLYMRRVFCVSKGIPIYDKIDIVTNTTVNVTL